MIYGIKSTVENLHPLHIANAIKADGISYVFVLVGDEPTAGCDVFLDSKDDTAFVYVKTEDQIEHEHLKNAVVNAMANYAEENYFAPIENPDGIFN